MRRFWLFGIPSLIAVSLTSCESVSGRAYVGFFRPEVAGETALDTSAGGLDLATRQVDVEDELGIDPTESIWAKAVIEPFDYGRFSVSAFRYDDESGGGLQSGYGDFAAGTSVNSDFSFDNLKLAYTYDIVDAGVFYFGPGVAVDIFDINQRVSVVTSESLETTVAVPMLYAQAGANLGVAELALEAGWMSLDFDDARGTYWDLEANLFVSVAPHVELVAGYRFISIDGDGIADGRRFDADIELRGWFIGGGISF